MSHEQRQQVVDELKNAYWGQVDQTLEQMKQDGGPMDKDVELFDRMLAGAVWIYVLDMTKRFISDNNK